MLMDYERTIEAAIRRATQAFPLVLATGPRQVGKSTLLERMLFSTTVAESMIFMSVPSVPLRRPMGICSPMVKKAA